MVAAEALRALSLAGLLLGTASGQLSLLLLGALGFIGAAGTVGFSVAAPALVPALVTLNGYFQPNACVRDGYMRVNSSRAVAHRPPHTEGIDASRIEEVRIVLIVRPAWADPAADRRSALLRQLEDAGTLGAWYSLADGPVAALSRGCKVRAGCGCPRPDASRADHPGRPPSARRPWPPARGWQWA